MNTDRARVFEELIQLSPLCSGSLHQQYLKCGKANCRCHDKEAPQPHGPYFLWERRIGGKQVNRTLRPGPKLEKVKEGIANLGRVHQLLDELVKTEESRILADEESATDLSKKNFKPRSPKR
jgi:hypothetical protein